MKTFSNIIITLSVVLLLSGCGSDGDSINTSNAQSDFEDESRELENTPVSVEEQPEEHGSEWIPFIIGIFDWNKASNKDICKALEQHNSLTIGAEFIPKEDELNELALNALETIIHSRYSEAFTITGRENRISTLTLDVNDCSKLSELRELSEVKFIDPEYALPTIPEDLFHFVISMGQAEEPPLSDDYNPAYYDPLTASESYLSYLKKTNVYNSNKTTFVMETHKINEIYEKHAQYGNPEIGVALFDNGVWPTDIDYFMASNNFQTQGAYPSFEESDGISPLETDFLSLLQFIRTKLHGSVMLSNVFKVAPKATLRSVRVSPFVILYEPQQFNSITNAILEMAVDPQIKVISASLGTLIHIHKIERAIEYFNAHDKIYVSAGGSSPINFTTKLIGIGFPANLSSTVSATGIKSLEETNGEWVLGELAHGGPENDFVVQNQDASSPATSHTAAMISLIWSGNPTLTREQVLQVMKESSTYYLKDGKKHPKYGWGMVNALMAYEKALAL